MVKITVVKKILIDELIAEIDDSKYLPFEACDVFEVGQVFVFKDIDDEMPKGFCTSAWNDIYRDVMMIMFGAAPAPKLKTANSMYSCCT